MSAIAHGLYHLLVEHQVFFRIESFIFVFFTIWWSWMNYALFSSAYDNDDVIFRILTFFKFFDCSRVHSRNCLHNDRKTKFCTRIHRAYYYACYHGFIMAQGSKMRSKNRRTCLIYAVRLILALLWGWWLRLFRWLPWNVVWN